MRPRGFARKPGSLPHIPELGEYPAIGMTASTNSISVGKFGARFPFSWEAWSNDDYGVIAQIPDGLVTLAKRTEDTETFGVLLDASGWNAANWPSTSYLQAATINGISTTINDVLTRESLSAALMQAKTIPPPNVSGESYLNLIQKWALVVPPNLVPIAQYILQAQQLRITDGAGTVSVMDNALGQYFEIVETPYIQTLSGQSTYKSTMWGITPINGQGTNAPTIVTTFLRGEETPELRIRDEAGDTLAGGELSDYSGSFDNDSIDIRVRYFCGAYLTSREGTVLSKGTKAA